MGTRGVNGIAAACVVSALVASGLTVIGGGPASAAALLPTGFVETAHFAGLTTPTSTAFAPDGSVFVTEKRGIVKSFSGLTDTTSTVTIDLRTNVHSWNDRGMSGVTVDPQYPQRPYIYVNYTLDAVPGGQPPRWGGTADTDGCPDSTNGCLASGRVSRIPVDPATGVATGPEEPLVTDWCQQYASHSNDDLAFGPDGMLYASAGDGASYSFSDWGQQGNPCQDPPTPTQSLSAPDAMGGSLRAQSPRRPATEPASLDGSIIRIDPTAGAPAPGNPFADAQDRQRRSIVAYGFRNPFRMTFKPGTHQLWVGDVGHTAREELNLLADATDGEAENFGWPCFEGTLRRTGFDNADLTLCESLYSQGGNTPPSFEYAHDAPVTAGEPCATGSSSVSALAFYTGASYPSRYKGGLFFGDYSRSCMWFAPAKADGSPDFSNVENFASADGGFRPVDLDIGPNGDLFVTDVSAGLVRRIVFAGNQPPQVTASASPTSGSVPLTVQFDASGSIDPEGQPLSFAWDLDGDGEFDDSTAPSPSYVYTAPGTISTAVRVSDPGGQSATKNLTVDAANDAPVITVSNPPDGFTWKVGDPIRLEASATDMQDGNLAPSAFDWTVSIKHCPSNCHDHIAGQWSGTNIAELTAPDHEAPSRLEATVIARDSMGAVGSKTVTLLPQEVPLQMNADPAGLSVSTGFESATTPYTRNVIVGSTNSVSAPATQTFNGRAYQFLRWSDDGEPSHNVVVGADPLELTAFYEDIGPAEGDTTPPSAPDQVTGAAEGAQVNLAWVASTDDFGVARYRIHRSASSGFLPTGATGVGTTEDLVWSQVDVPPGTYYYKVVAEDAAGNESPPSQEVKVVVPDDTTPPAEPTGLASATAGSEATLWWTPVPAETGLVYEVHRGTSDGFTTSSATRVATVSDPAYQDRDLGEGTWYYRILARDDAGNRSTASSSTRAIVNIAQAPTVLRDTFDRSLSSGWGTAGQGGTWNLGTTSAYSANGVSGLVRNDSPGTDRNAHLPSSDTRDVDSVVVFRPDTKALTGAGQTLKILSRRQAQTHEYRTSVQMRGDSSLILGLKRKVPNTAEAGPTVTIPGGFVRGRDYAVRTMVTGANPTTLKAKIWEASAQEPTTWAITWTDSSSSLQGAGDFGIASYVSSSATGTPITTGIDLAIAGSGAPVDRTAPTPPTGVTASTTSDVVTVRWTASTDNEGVAGYRVYRGTTPDFAIADGILRGTVGATTLAFNDSPVPSGTHYYRVVAVDLAGNASEPSDDAEVVVDATAPTEQKVSVLPGADAFANQASPTATSGTSWVLKGRGGTSQQIPYLRFEMPTTPVGKSLVGATLQVTASNNSWAGTTASYEVRRVTDTTWSESALTWNNRPSVSSTVLGTLPPGTAPGQEQQAALDTTALPSPSQPFSVALTSTSSDNMEIASRENPGSKPTLILTYR